MQFLHTDLHEDDRFFWFSTTGWMMWNYLVGGLLTDASIVLYDGSPFHPGPEAMWQLAADAGVTVFGTSAAFIAASMKAGVEPRPAGATCHGSSPSARPDRRSRPTASAG